MINLTGWGMLNELRNEEGNSVTIFCDNPDGPPNNAIECCGDWTNWEPLRFERSTLLQCLNDAVLAKRTKESK